jgi:hypothetical protein
MPLRPPVGQMLVSHVEKSSITSGPHGPPLDELLLVVVVTPPVPLLVVAPLVAFDPPVPFDPPAPLLVTALELEVPLDVDACVLTQTESMHVRFERHTLPGAHGHFS